MSPYRVDDVYGKPTPQGRPTVYNGVHMRSRLEATYAAHLDSCGDAWTYEPNAFASARGQYLPDFRVIYRDHVCEHCGEVHPYYVEVKPRLPADEIAKWQRRMEIIWASEPDACLILELWEEQECYWVAGRCCSGRRWRHHDYRRTYAENLAAARRRLDKLVKQEHDRIRRFEERVVRDLLNEEPIP